MGSEKDSYQVGDSEPEVSESCNPRTPIAIILFLRIPYGSLILTNRIPRQTAESGSEFQKAWLCPPSAFSHVALEAAKASPTTSGGTRPAA